MAKHCSGDLADYIARRIDVLRKRGKTARQIADEIGYKKPNMISMLKTGRAKVPFEKIPALARALDVDVALLFRLALSEYWPDKNKAIAEVFGSVLTANEKTIVDTIREFSKKSELVLSEGQRRQLVNIFE